MQSIRSFIFTSSEAEEIGRGDYLNQRVKRAAIKPTTQANSTSEDKLTSRPRRACMSSTPR